MKRGSTCFGYFYDSDDFSIYSELRLFRGIITNEIFRLTVREL